METHFTEWNYVAPGAWSSKEREEIRDAFMRTHGGPGAAFASSVLAYMQETELDIACFYAAFGSIFRFGFFDRYGAPTKQYYTFKAFNELVKCGTRLEVSGNKRETGVGIVAAVNEKSGEAAVLLSNFEDEASHYTLEMKHLPFKEQIVCSEFVIDDEHVLDFDREQIISSSDFKIVVELPKESVRLIIFK
jgi:xylan 1,4-beta-xylosidase